MRKTLGYMVTWTTYGTWLQGDERGYVKDGTIRPSNDNLKYTNQKQQKFQAVNLSSSQKHIVREVILQEAEKINQKIPAIAVCSNHVHIVAGVSSEAIEQIVHRYKRSTTFALREAGVDGKVWTKGFDKRYCFDEAALNSRIEYVQRHERH